MIQNNLCYHSLHFNINGKGYAGINAPLTLNLPVIEVIKQNIFMFCYDHFLFAEFFKLWHQIKCSVTQSESRTSWEKPIHSPESFFCADCGGKMYNHRHRTGRIRKDMYTNGKQRYIPPEDCYNCANYNLSRQKYVVQCSSHSIQTWVIRQLVLDTIKKTCDFALSNEEELLQQKKEGLRLEKKRASNRKYMARKREEIRRQQEQEKSKTAI